MNKLLLFLALAASIAATAQNVGVGTTTPAAKLDITSSNSGVLIPRIALTGSNDMTTVPSATNATLIFNTATVTGAYAITPGLYWWNSTLATWTKVLDNASTPGDTNIYNTNGTLTGNRTITMGADSITFSATNGSFRYSTTNGNVEMGNAVSASGGNSVALGYRTVASGAYSTALGFVNFALGNYSTAIGADDSAAGNSSFASGYGSNARSYLETSLGSCNTLYTPVSATAWNTADRLFGVGNGANPASRSDAMVILKNGNVGISTAGPLTTLDLNGGALIRGGNTNTLPAPVSAAEFATGRQQNGTLASGQTTADIAFQYASGGFRHFIQTRHFSGTGYNTNAIDFYLNNSATAAGSSAPGTGNVNIMTLTPIGVGVNTNAPVSLLDVKGSDWNSAGTNDLMIDNPAAIYGPTLRFNGPSHVYDIIGSTGTSANTGAGYFGIWDNTAFNYRFVIAPSGNTGIGTTAPGAQLEVSTVTGTGDTSEVRISSLNQGWNSTRLSFYSDRGSAYEWRPGYIVSGDNSPGNFGGRLDFVTNGLGTANKTSRVTAMSVYNGMVGIGTLVPVSALTIGATNQFQVNSTGNIVEINSVATSFPAAQGAAGTVLTNNGSGTLSWANPGSDLTAGTGITISGNTINSYWTASGADIDNNNSGEIIAVSGSMFANFGTGSVQHMFNTAGAGYGTIQNDGNGIWSLGYTGNAYNNTALGTPDLSWTRGGFVGIGTTAPAARLTVIGDGSGTAYIGGNFCGSSYTGISLNGLIGACGDYNMLSSPSDQNLYINRPTGNSIRFRENNADEVTIAATTGYLGIGTTTPSAPVYINTSNTSFNEGNYTYYAKGSGTGNSGTGCFCTLNANVGNVTGVTANVSLYAAGRIEGAEFDANSDQRIKKDFGPSDPTDDIETLYKLRVTDFRYRDEVENGPDFKKGFIAQQVQTVYPQAVSTHTDFLPDVYALPEAATIDAGILTVHMKNIHGFCDGDMVRLITPEGRKEVKVSVIDDLTFTVADWTDGITDVFVYGKRTDDFLAVDYDRIYTLGISAIQTLGKKLEVSDERIQKLEEENNAISSKANEQAAMIRSMKAQLDAINERLNIRTELK